MCPVVLSMPIWGRLENDKTILKGWLFWVDFFSFKEIKSEYFPSKFNHPQFPQILNCPKNPGRCDNDSQKCNKYPPIQKFKIVSQQKTSSKYTYYISRAVTDWVEKPDMTTCHESFPTQKSIIIDYEYEDEEKKKIKIIIIYYSFIWPKGQSS